MKIRLHNVLLVPKLGKSLVSVSAMSQRGATISFEGDKCFIKKHDGVVGVGYKKGNLFTLEFVSGEARVALSKESLELWHRRMGHLNVQTLRKGLSEGVFEGVENVASGSFDCVSCAEGKQHKSSVPKVSSSGADELLGVIHSDVCGPMEVPSLGGARYFVTFIDDKSRFCQVSFLKNKSGVLDAFKRFACESETQVGCKVKVLRCDNGGEYRSNAFDVSLGSRGIKLRTTVPYTPEQNGVAERMNRTLVESARSMMSQASLGKEFWAEAVNTAVHIRNRVPSVAVGGVTPIELWSGKKPDVSYFRVFGCPVDVHVPDEKRQKLDSKSKKMVFVGYPEGQKGYKCFDREQRRMIVSRNVKFKEFQNESSVVRVELTSEDESTAESSPDAQIGVEVKTDDVSIPSTSSVQATYEDTFLKSVDKLPDKRQRKAPERLVESCCLAELEEPSSLREAMESDASENWKEALRDEYNSLRQNGTWELVPLPKGKNIVGCRWVFKVKRNAEGGIDRYKARLVAQGFSQKEGLDFEEVFSPVVKHTSIRVLFALSVQLGWFCHQIDIKTAFLNGTIKEEIYMRQPEGFVDEENPQHVCRLVRSLYGLKQSARCWNERLHEFLTKAGFVQCASDCCLYSKSVGGLLVMLVVYVDDILIFCSSLERLEAEKKALKDEFKLVDQGEVHHILGMIVKKTNSGLHISQPTFVEGVLKKCGMEHSKPVSSPLEVKLEVGDEKFKDVREYQVLVGSLVYLMTATRPDLAFAVSWLTQHMSSPYNNHWVSAKRVLRYLRGTAGFGLGYVKLGGSVELVGYSDSSWANNPEDRTSNAGYCFFLSGCLVSWKSHKQRSVARSSTEAEYVSLSECIQEAIWLKSLLKDMGFDVIPITIFEDNLGAIELCKNPKFHSRTKHIDVHYHFCRQFIQNGSIIVKYCPTKDMVADIFTKSLPGPGFMALRKKMGIED